MGTEIRMLSGQPAESPLAGKLSSLVRGTRRNHLLPGLLGHLQPPEGRTERDSAPTTRSKSAFWKCSKSFQGFLYMGNLQPPSETFTGPQKWRLLGIYQIPTRGGCFQGLGELTEPEPHSYLLGHSFRHPSSCLTWEGRSTVNRWAKGASGIHSASVFPESSRCLLNTNAFMLRSERQKIQSNSTLGPGNKCENVELERIFRKERAEVKINPA